MKKWWLAVLMGSVLLAQMPEEALAKRLGGGGSSGMRRSIPTQPVPRAPDAPSPSRNAAPTQPAAPAPGQMATPPKRNWMGPIAGLAAGLGIAALMSHFGMGGALANFMTMALLAVAAVFVIGWLMRRFGKPAASARQDYAFAGASPAERLQPEVQPVPQPQPQPFARQTDTPYATGSNAGHVPVAFDPTLNGASASGPHLPADFDQPAFERLARMIFIRMQAANDAGDLDDLRTFTTPEMFAEARISLQDRGAAKQVTDVVEVAAQVLDLAEENGRQIVSVRYHGRIRETEGGPVEAFDEVWHLVKAAGATSQWAIAGIQQSQ